MTRDEIVELLQLIHVYDNRKLDRLTVAAWCESAKRARWTREAAEDAVHEHFAHAPREWLMPGHITERIRATRRQPAPVDDLRALDPGPPASAECRAEVMAKVRELANKKSIAHG